MSNKKGIKDRIAELPLVRMLLRWSKRYAFPGFDEVPLYDVLNFVILEAQKDNITTRANSIAYSFFLALFPGIIFLLPIIANTPFAENYLDLFRESIQGVIPLNAENYIFDIVDEIQKKGTYGWLSLGFFLSIYFSSNGMLSLMQGFDKSYETTFKGRNFLWKRIVALTLTLLLATLMIVSIILIVMSKHFFGWIITELGLNQYETIAFVGIRWIVVIMLFYSVITSIYRFGTSMYTRINFISPGASLATIFSILTSVLFSYFINNFGRYNEIYGSIGALIVILIWFQLNAFILLAGFELNASIAVNRDLRNQKTMTLKTTDPSTENQSGLPQR